MSASLQRVPEGQVFRVNKDDITFRPLKCVSYDTKNLGDGAYGKFKSGLEVRIHPSVVPTNSSVVSLCGYKETLGFAYKSEDDNIEKRIWYQATKDKDLLLLGRVDLDSTETLTGIYIIDPENKTVRAGMDAKRHTYSTSSRVQPNYSIDTPAIPIDQFHKDNPTLFIPVAQEIIHIKGIKPERVRKISTEDTNTYLLPSHTRSRRRSSSMNLSTFGKIFGIVVLFLAAALAGSAGTFYGLTLGYHLPHTLLYFGIIPGGLAFITFIVGLVSLFLAAVSRRKHSREFIAV